MPSEHSHSTGLAEDVCCPKTSGGVHDTRTLLHCYLSLARLRDWECPVFPRWDSEECGRRSLGREGILPPHCRGGGTRLGSFCSFRRAIHSCPEKGAVNLPRSTDSRLGQLFRVWPKQSLLSPQLDRRRPGHFSVVALLRRFFSFTAAAWEKAGVRVRRLSGFLTRVTPIHSFRIDRFSRFFLFHGFHLNKVLFCDQNTQALTSHPKPSKRGMETDWNGNVGRLYINS